MKLNPLFVLFLGSLLMAGCVSRQSVSNNAPTEVAPIAGSTSASTKLKPNQRYIVSEPIEIQSSNSPSGQFNARMIYLADQLERNVDRKILNNTFIVTSFTNLNRLSETTSFGRLVSEDMIHELQVRKWQVFEVRLTKDIIINDTGEFSLSRDINKLKELYKIGGIVTGTYSVAGNSIIVNARVIDINTGIVVSSAQTHLPLNWFTDNLLFSDDHLRVMRIVGGDDTSVQRRFPAPYPSPDVMTPLARPAGAGH
jgi:TolB-like protein